MKAAWGGQLVASGLVVPNVDLALLMRFGRVFQNQPNQPNPPNQPGKELEDVFVILV